MGEEAPSEVLGKQEYLSPLDRIFCGDLPIPFFALRISSSFTFSFFYFSPALSFSPLLSFLLLPWAFKFSSPHKPLSWAHWEPTVPVC